MNIPKIPQKEASFIHATLDIETDPFRGPTHPKGERLPEAFCIGFWTGTDYFLEWGADCIRKMLKRIIKWCGKQTKKVVIYAHNGGKFDAHFMLAEILEELSKLFSLDELPLFCIGSRIVEIETPVCSFRDSFALIPKPLKSFAKKDDIEIEKLEPEVREKNKDEICKYLRQDCVGLYDGLSAFFQLYGTGLTLASTAFKILARDFGGKIKRTNDSYDTKFREAFFAGRVQFFGLGKFGELDGKRRYEIVDINSSFPYAMTFSHWFSDKYTLIEKINPEFKNECFYEVVCDSLGGLPVRGKDGVSFPVVAHNRFFVVGYELFMAQKLGTIKNLKIKAIYLPEEINDFNDYVQYFYKLKKEAKTAAERDFAKLFLNASYGKFAQNNRDAKDSLVTLLGKVPEPRLEKQGKNIAIVLKIQAALMKRAKKKIKTKTIRGITGEIIEYEDKEFLLRPKTPPENSCYFCNYWEHQFDDERRGLTFWGLPTQKKEGFNEFHNVATAASITALARAKLAEAMHKSKGVLYCDTDSVLAENTKTLEKGEALGEWKLEKECDAVWIGGKKLYIAHAYKDCGLTTKKTGEKIFKEVHLPAYNFHRYYLTKKDFDDSWKLASKGVRLKVEDLIAVCEGEERKFSFDAPNYSTRSRPRFTTRTVRRDDKRKRR